MLKKKSLKNLLSKGKPVLGVFQGFFSPQLVEMYGRAGFDFVVLDTEHGPMSADACEGLVRAADCVQMPAIVRVSANQRHHILRALDIGAEGVLIPMVNSVEEACQAVQYTKYYPVGVRGLAFSTRAAGYGFNASSDYLQKCNELTLCITQMETKQAYSRLDDILKTNDLDVIFIGPTDLSQTLGFYGDTNHPELIRIMEDAIRRITTAGKTAGVFVSNFQSAEKWFNAGARFITFGSTGLLTAPMKECAHNFKNMANKK